MQINFIGQLNSSEFDFCHLNYLLSTIQYKGIKYLVFLKVRLNVVLPFLKILQTSEKQLAKKLAEKGDQITRDDIIYLLGDHLRTIEQLQV